MYTLLNQNSLSDVWQSLRLEMNSSGVSDPVINELIQHSEETKTDEQLISADETYALNI